MDYCLICLEFNDKFAARVYTASEEWHSYNMPAIIQKHLSCWFDHNEIVDHTEEQWMCRQCWQLLIAFNKLYEKIEKQNCQELLTHVNVEIKEENALEEAMIPLSVSSDFKIENESITLLEISTIDARAVKKNKRYETNMEDVEMITETFIEQQNEADQCNVSNSNDDDQAIASTDEKAPRKIKKRKTENRCHDMEKYNQILLEMQYTLTCSICSEDFIDFRQLKSHFREQHTIRGYAECCGRKHYTSLELVEHINWHDNPEYFKCPECGKAQISRFSLETHIKLHTDSQLFHCKECDKSFKKKSRLSHHMLTHMPEDQKQYSCEECSKRYPSMRCLQQHMNAVHLNAYVRICDLCGAKFRERFAFERHMEEHDKGQATRFTCEICSAELKSKYLLNRHMNYKHNEKYLQPEKCPHCNFVGSTYLNLKTHIRRHHTKTPEHKCHLCGKIFQRPKKLKEHISTHTGEPLYTCLYCPRTFNCSSNMYKHRIKEHYEEWEKNHKNQRRELPINCKGD